jgi:hypothetical protein
VVGFTIGSRGKKEVPGKTCEKRIRNNSVKFSSLLLVCCINSQKAKYRYSTREDKNNNNQVIRNYMAVEKVKHKCN